jgi:hypothetical protein
MGELSLRFWAFVALRAHRRPTKGLSAPFLAAKPMLGQRGVAQPNAL